MREHLWELEATVKAMVASGDPISPEAIKRLRNEVVVPLRAALSTQEQPIPVAVCEVGHIILRPGALYRPYVAPGCERCAPASAYEDEGSLREGSTQEQGVEEREWLEEALSLAEDPEEDASGALLNVTLHLRDWARRLNRLATDPPRDEPDSEGREPEEEHGD